tara:strand:- start:125 stop:520 length:396 start_codon:yes stop_codon:yes gene_type:complete
MARKDISINGGYENYINQNLNHAGIAHLTGSVNQFENHGHPGTWVYAQTVAAGDTVAFTGSNAGVSGVMFGARSGIQGTGGTVTFTGGGTINTHDMHPSTGSIYEFSVKEITNGVGGVITALFTDRPTSRD